METTESFAVPEHEQQTVSHEYVTREAEKLSIRNKIGTVAAFVGLSVAGLLYATRGGSRTPDKPTSPTYIKLRGSKLVEWAEYDLTTMLYESGLSFHRLAERPQGAFASYGVLPDSDSAKKYFPNPETDTLYYVDVFVRAVPETSEDSARTLLDDKHVLELHVYDADTEEEIGIFDTAQSAVDAMAKDFPYVVLQKAEKEQRLPVEAEVPVQKGARHTSMLPKSAPPPSGAEW